MALFTRSLWPDTVKRPYLRLVLALILAPLLLGSLLGILTFLVGGVSEPDQAATIDYTLGVLPYLLGAVMAFVATFGLVGIAVLWSFGQRAVVVWAIVGGGMGAMAGGVVGLFGSIEPVWVPPVGFGILGWLLFLMIRAIAGVRAPARQKIEI